MINRSSGLLLNISSLPSDFGIGGFGWEVKEACDFIAKCGFHCWQTLPITAIGEGNSPYSSQSAFALNYLYVNPYLLRDKGWISEQDAQNCRVYDNGFAVDYKVVSAKKGTAIKIAFDNAKAQIIDKLRVFEIAKRWVSDYAIFMTISNLTDGAPWWLWNDDFRSIANIDKTKFVKEYFDQYYYYIFEQYVCDEQWSWCRQVAKENNIKIIGDIPMYVCHNSADVWSSPQSFLLDKDFCPSKVAGVPPDYFSSEGQLWGNPLYDYKSMSKNNFEWWISRFDRMFELYDVLRIDHFRAFSEFWAVDKSEKTAKNGKWQKGVGMDLLSIAIDKYGADSFIAEDLGIIDDKVQNLLEKTGLCGMRVMQFGFEDGDSIHLPHNFNQKSIAYTATHDNNTTLGWLYQLSHTTRDYALRYVGCEVSGWDKGGFGCPSTKAFIKSLMSSCARLAIVPFQDLCGFGADCRMNTPGIAEGNWTFRATKQAMQDCDSEYFCYLSNLYGRNRAL